MGVRFAARMIDSLVSPPQVTFPAQGRTWLTADPEWIEYFGLTISAHHGRTAEPLGLRSFETAFRRACEAVGWTLDPPGSVTQRFLDLTVHTSDSIRRRLSLKSTAARNLSPTSVHISKLTEAARIQDVRSARARRERTLELFKQYRDAVDAIVMLRAFRHEPHAVPNLYQLVEIPSGIFTSLASVPLSEFKADGPTIDCSFDGLSSAARVSLDRSDAKITVKQIQLKVCQVHAEWELK